MKGGDSYPSRDHVEADGVVILPMGEEGPLRHILKLSHRTADVNGNPQIDRVEVMGHLTPPGEAVTWMLGPDKKLDGGRVDLVHTIPVHNLVRHGRVDD